MKGEYLILASIEGVDDLRVLKTEHGTILFGKEAASVGLSSFAKTNQSSLGGCLKQRDVQLHRMGKS
jgi:hypothetical protein